MSDITGAVHQFVATAEPGAVGTHSLHLQRLIRESVGVPSEIYAEHRKGPFVEHAKPLTEYRGRRGHVLIYQMAIGSDVADFVLREAQRQSGSIVVNHHNLTPVRYLRSWDPGGAFGVAWGVRQLHEMASHARLGIADSTFNEDDLRQAGYRCTTVAPVLFDPTGLAARPDDPVLAGAIERAPGARWLFVGRLAANKCQHHLIRALAVYRRLYDSEARLSLVGGPPSGLYRDALRAYTRELGLDGAVVLTGPVTATQLATYYRHADVFVCLSEHEGFCVPLIEAMTFGLPVVAGRSSAIPETAANAALLLPGSAGQPEAAAVAAAVWRIMSNLSLRRALIDAGRARAGQLTLPHTLATMYGALMPVIGDR